MALISPLGSRRQQLERVRADAAKSALPTPIWLSESWSLSSAHIRPSLRSAPVGDPDAFRNDYAQSEAYRLIHPILEDLVHVVGREGFAIGLSDSEATLMWTASNAVMARALEKTHFVPSARWGEQSFGTNAVGLSARSAMPAQVFSAEHYVQTLHEWVCYASPIIHPRSGQLMGVLDISAPWQMATPLAMSTVEHYAEKMAQAWGNLGRNPYLLSLCQNGDAALRFKLPKRQQEIFLTLALHPEGLSTEALHAYVFGDAPISMSTLKSEIHHLRQHLGEQVLARPYRLNLAKGVFATDAQWVEHLCLTGKVADAVRHYQKAPLHNSNAPAIIEYRQYLHQLVSQTLMAQGDADSLWRFVQHHRADDELLQWLLAHLPLEDNRRFAIQARLTLAD